MARRLVLLLVAIATPMSMTSAGAQGPPLTLPPGIWEGSVLFNGTYELTGIAADGRGYTSLNEVTASSINFEMLVDRQGAIVDGDMEVDIAWVHQSTGTAPATNQPYDIFSEQRQTGALSMSGDASRITATGTLDWETMVYDSEGDLIEEVSGTEPAELEWVFRAVESSCASVSGPLAQSDGSSLVGTALIPQVIFEDNREIVNNIVAVLWAWPQFADPTVMADAVLEVTEAAEEVLLGVPTVEELEQLVRLIEAVRLELARLEACRIPVAGFVPQYNDSFLAIVLRQALTAALQLGEYTPQELITLLNIGARGEAINAELHQQFGEALSLALDQALEDADFDSIKDIAAAAGRYGYPDLYAEAMELLAEQEE